MTWVAVAVAGGAIVGGVISAQGSKDAASTQAGAATNAAQITQQQYQNTVKLEQPYTNSGYGAQSELNWLLGISPQDSSGNTLGQPSSSQQPSYGGGGQPANGYDPSSGWGVGPGGGMHQYLTNGAAGNGQGYAGKGSPGVPSYASAQAGNKPGGTAAGPQQHPMTVGANGQPTGNAGHSGGYGSLLSPFTADTFHKMSPAYKFQMEQGQQGVLNGDASNSGALSGAAQKDLIGYNQGMADTAFNNAFNQYQTQQGNIYARLAGVANQGQNAASNTGTVGANLAASSAQSITNAGSATAAGQIGAANAYSGAVGTASMLPWLMQQKG